jgi:hypothetical protein
MTHACPNASNGTMRARRSEAAGATAYQDAGYAST